MFALYQHCFPISSLSKKACSCLQDIAAIKRNPHISINTLLHHIAYIPHSKRKGGENDVIHRIQGEY